MSSVPYFLDSNDVILQNVVEDLDERSLMVLGNVALGGGDAGRAARGCAARVLRDMRTTTPLRQLRTLVRTYSNLYSDCADDERLVETVSPALPYLRELLDIEDDKYLDEDDKESPFIARDIIVDVCTALANIMLGPAECTEAMQAVPGLTARLVALLEHETGVVQRAALSAVANMLAGTEDQVDRCLKANCLEHIPSLLQSSNHTVVTEAARAAGNIFAGTLDQIREALDFDMLILLRNILTNGDQEGRKQAAYAVSNFCCNGAGLQHEHLLTSGVLPPYCALLAAPDLQLAADILNVLNELIQVCVAGKYDNLETLCYVLDASDIVDHMEILERHNNITDEDCCKIANIKAMVRKHAREQRFVVHDHEVFTAQKIAQDLVSGQQETVSRAVGAAYCLLREQHAPVNALLEAGIMPMLVNGLDAEACPDLRSFAAWALSKITAGTRRHKTAAIDSGAIPKLLALLSRGDEIAILASCTLGNLALHGPETRDAILVYLNSETAITELRSFAQAYEKWCSESEEKKKPVEEYERLLQAMPFLSELLDVGDTDIIVDICWACFSIMLEEDELKEVMQAVPGHTARLVALLGHEHTEVQRAASSAVTCMLSGTDAQTERCLEAGCFDPLFALLHSNNTLIFRAVRALRIILYHNKGSHLQQAIDKDILPMLRKLLTNDYAEIQEEAVFMINVMCEFVSPKQRLQLLSSGIMETFCEVLATRERDLAIADYFINAIFLLLQDDDAKWAVCSTLDKIGVIKHLQRLLDLDIDKDLHRKIVEVNTVIRYWGRKENIVLEDGKVFTATDIVQDLKSEDLACQMRAASAAYTMTSEEISDQIELVQAGAIAPLVAALDKNDCSDLQSDAACTLANIVHKVYEHRVAVVNSEAIPKLVAILRHGGEPATGASRALGHLVRRSPVARDLVLAHGAVTAILPHLRPHTTLNVLKSFIDLYEKLCCIIISPSLLELVSPALPYIAELLKMEDEEVLETASDAIGNLMLGIDESVDAVQDVPGLTKRLVALMGHVNTDVQQSALNAVANMLGGTEEQADRCLDVGCLQYIVPLLESSETYIVEGATRAICNIVQHTDSQIQLALDKNILPPILKILADAEPNSFVQYYAVQSLKHITTLGTREQVMAIVNNGAIPILVAVLYHKEKVAQEAAEALANLAEDFPETKDLVLAHGTVKALLPNLQRDTPLELLQSCVELYKNLCEDLSPSQLQRVSPGIPYICDLLTFEDEDVMESALRAIGKLISGGNEIIEVIQPVSGVMTRVMELLTHESVIVKTIAWYVVTCMLRGNGVQCKRCIAAGCIGQFIACLRDYQYFDLKTSFNTLDYFDTIKDYTEKLHGNALNSLTKMSLDILEKAWIPFVAMSGLTYITVHGSMEDRKSLINAEVTAKLTAFLSLDDLTAQNAALAIGNLCKQHVEAGQLMLAQGTVQKLMPLLHPDVPLSVLKYSWWAYRSFCGHQFDDPMEKLQLLSPALMHVEKLLDIEDRTLRRHVCWSLVNLCEQQEFIEVVQAMPGLTARLLAMLAVGHHQQKWAMINVALLMLSGTDAQAIRCLEANCVEPVLSYLQDRDEDLIKLAAEATRKVLGEDHPRLTWALDPNVLTPLMIVLDTKFYTTEDQQRVVKGISYLCQHATAAQRARLLACGVLEPFYALLGSPHHTVAVEVLNSLQVLIQVATRDDNLESFSSKLDEIGILEQMLQLLEHDNVEIKEKVSSLLTTLFD